MGLTLRTLKGSRLTHEELDDNFRHFTGSHTVDGTVTATGFVGDGSGLTGVTAAANLTGTGVVSGSVQLDGERFGFGADIEATGSFTGSFVGDGSGLTGIAGGASAIHLLSDVNIDTLTDGQYLSYDATSFKWLNVGAPAADLTGTNVISGSDFEYNTVDAKWSVGKRVELNNGLYVTSGPSVPIIFDNNNANSSDTVVRVLGPNDISSLTVKGSSTEVGNSLKVVMPAIGGGFLPGTDLVHARVFTQGGQNFGHVSASLFSGSFVGDGSGLTGITSDLTGTGIVSGSNWSYTPNNQYQGWNFTGPFSMGGNFANFGDGMYVNGANIIFGGTFSSNVRFTNSEVRFVPTAQGSWYNDAEIVIKGNTGHISASLFSGSFEGDGSGLTGLPAGNVPLVAGTAANDLPLPANSVTGSMLLMDDGDPFNGTSPALYIYTGAATGINGWQSITLA